MVNRLARLAVGLTIASLVAIPLATSSSAAPRSQGPITTATSDPIAKALANAQTFMRTPTRIPQTVPLKTKPPAGKKIIFVSTAQPAVQLIAGGFTAAADAIGYSSEVLQYQQGNPAQLQAALLNALAKKPAAVAVVSVNADFIGNNVIQQYANAKVPLIIGNQCPLNVSPPLFKGPSLCNGEVYGGWAFAQWFIADSKCKGNVLFENTPAASGSLTTFIGSFKAEVARVCPSAKVDVMDMTIAQISNRSNITALVNKLRANPGDYQYLFFDNANWASGILPTLDAAGLLDTVKVGGRSMDETALAALKANQEVAWTATPYPVAGMGLVDSILRVLTKSSGIDKNSGMVIQIVTNLNASTVSTPYNAPTNALDQYLRLWKVKK